jgi:HlyD family secretion protein
MTDAPFRPLLWRRLLWPLVALALVGALAALVFARRAVVQTTPAPAVAPLVLPVEQRDLAEQVTLQGSLQPRERVSVRFPEDLAVREVLVAPGDAVTAGQPLARLETGDLELRVSSAQSRLDQAQAAVDQLQQGPTEAALVAATARVTSAEADLLAFAQEVQPNEIAVARQRLDAARQRLAALEQGTTLPADVASSRAQLASAQDALAAALVGEERARDTASRAKTDAQQAMERGAQDVQRLQRAFSDATWDWDFVQRTGRHPRETVPVDSPPPASSDGGTESSPAAPTTRTENRKLERFEVEQFRRALADAELALQNGETTLQNLVEAFEQARENEVRQVQEAERNVEAARRALADAERVAAQAAGEGLQAAVLQARGDVVTAEEAYRALVADPARGGRQAVLQAAIVGARDELAKLQGGPEAQALAEAQSALEQARADLAEAQAALDAATLRAPLAGTVVSLTLAPGVRTTAEDAVIIADLSAFRIVAPVNEQQVNLLQPAQEVSVQVDALPTAVLTGTILRVSELPQESEGGAAGVNPAGSLGGLYPVEVVTGGVAPGARVGMAVTVQATVVLAANALVVPFQAVQYGADGAPFVERVVGALPADGSAPATEQVPVTLGAQQADVVVVESGLSAGEQVVVPQLLAPPVPGMGGF